MQAHASALGGVSRPDVQLVNCSGGGSNLTWALGLTYDYGNVVEIPFAEALSGDAIRL